MVELDVVLLKKDYEDVPAGTVGTVMLVLDEYTVEVEFSDAWGEPLTEGMTISVPKDILTLLGAP